MLPFKTRPILDSDLQSVYQALSNPTVYQYYGVRYHTLEATKEQMQWYKSLVANNKGEWWAITSENEQEFYGACGLNNYEPEHRKAEVGFWLLPEYWGKGLAYRAVNQLLQYGFQKWNLHRIEAFVESGNRGSEKVLTRLGFAHEGTMRDYEFKDGRFVSWEVYGLLSGSDMPQ